MRLFNNAEKGSCGSLLLHKKCAVKRIKNVSFGFCGFFVRQHVTTQCGALRNMGTQYVVLVKE